MSAPAEDRRPDVRLWQAALGLVLAVLLVVGVGLLIARAAGFSEVRAAVEEAEPSWLALCLAAQVLALAGYADVFREAFRWRGGPDPGYRLSAHVMLASIGATRVFAAGGAGALAATYWCFRRARFPRREALVRVLGFNTLFYVSFALAAWAAALLLALGAWGVAPLGLTLPWLVLVPFCFAAAAFVTQPARLGAFTRGGGNVLRRALAVAIGGTAWVREVLPDPGGRRLQLSALLYWVGNALCLWAALRSVGVSLPLPELALAYATGHAATILPLPLGGVGGVDAAMTYALTVVGVDLASALVAVAVFRLFAFWAPTLPGLVALALLPRAGRGLERAAPVRA
ncbi:MAG TPA: lysylphosphatidylglycerol synthase transmembrane domain-containing protein [Gaiellaceae bacterium]|nr:lysylphosphatidylglycerol synthase transmembrane domain-containing protein [Gaiellaceae bacterium]